MLYIRILILFVAVSAALLSVHSVNAQAVVATDTVTTSMTNRLLLPLVRADDKPVPISQEVTLLSTVLSKAGVQHDKSMIYIAEDWKFGKSLEPAFAALLDGLNNNAKIDASVREHLRQYSQTLEAFWDFRRLTCIVGPIQLLVTSNPSRYGIEFPMNSDRICADHLFIEIPADADWQELAYFLAQVVVALRFNHSYDDATLDASQTMQYFEPAQYVLVIKELERMRGKFIDPAEELITQLRTKMEINDDTRLIEGNGVFHYLRGMRNTPEMSDWLLMHMAKVIAFWTMEDPALLHVADAFAFPDSVIPVEFPPDHFLRSLQGMLIGKGLIPSLGYAHLEGIKFNILDIGTAGKGPDYGFIEIPVVGMVTVDHHNYFGYVNDVPITEMKLSHGTLWCDVEYGVIKGRLGDTTSWLVRFNRTGKVTIKCDGSDSIQVDAINRSLWLNLNFTATILGRTISQSKAVTIVLR